MRRVPVNDCVNIDETKSKFSNNDLDENDNMGTSTFRSVCEVSALTNKGEVFIGMSINTSVPESADDFIKNGDIAIDDNGNNFTVSNHSQLNALMAAVSASEVSK